MSAPPTAGDVDPPPDAELAALFSALSTPTRIAILRAVRRPRILSEIEVKGGEGEAEGRVVARQTVRKHLDVLVETGLVAERPAERERGETREFVIQHQRVFAMVEAARNLARLKPTVETEGPTESYDARAHAAPRPPCLVVVKGLDEGTWFPLPRAGEPAVVIGRRRECDVALDFDPYVSGENARVSWDGREHVIEDVPGSRNGTSVNFAPLPSGGRRALARGDVVGVGRSLLVYWS